MPTHTLTATTPATVHLRKADVDAIFDTATHQAEVVVRLYRLVYPNWDAIAEVDGYPQVHPATADYLMRRAIAFDQRHHPAALAGGRWINSGWGQGGVDLHEWEVAPAPVTLLATPQ